METNDFVKFRDFLLGELPFFQAGYVNCFKDAEMNGIYTRNKEDLIPVFPQDKFGNYFYLRNDMTVNFAPERSFNLGCEKGYIDTINIDLIAMVRGADAWKLINAIRNTVVKFPDMQIRAVNALWNREQIVRDELRGMDGTEKAVARLRGWTVAKIRLLTAQKFLTGDCDINVCDGCM